MMSLNALDRGTGVRRLFLNAAGTGLAAAAIASELVLAPVARVRFAAGDAAGGRVTVRDGLPLLEVRGDASAIGAACGALLRNQIRPLLRLMGMHPPLIAARLLGRVRPLTDGIPIPYRTELAAMAGAAGIATAALEKANLVVDTCCSALVRGEDRASGRPLTIARNMDFYPASVLGPATMVSLVRAAGKRAVASVGWPGYAGVISGMNDHGVCACILLNYGARGPRPGTPIGFRAREVLEDAVDLASAVERFSCTPVASSHYLLMADEHGAAVCWQDADGAHRHDLGDDGWLACSNGPRDPATRLAIDDRGRRLRAFADDAPSATENPAAGMRRAMTASYLRAINTQAMLFIPATRTLQLALGTGTRAAALNGWTEIALSGAFTGGTLADAPLRVIAPVDAPERHYTA
jgi:isopenicillin-N N-acyltransferase like protein